MAWLLTLATMECDVVVNSLILAISNWPCNLIPLQKVLKYSLVRLPSMSARRAGKRTEANSLRASKKPLPVATLS